MSSISTFCVESLWADKCFVSHRLAEYIQSEPERKRVEAEAKKAKLEALERKLGIDPGEPSGSGTSTPPVLPNNKRRFDDTQYLEQSRDIVDGVKSAVAAGELRFVPFTLTVEAYLSLCRL